MKIIQEFDFNEVSNETLKLLENVKEMVFSTSLNDHVTSRTVSTACKGTTIVFLSYKNNTKCIQIKGNPNVALCFENIQIEGVATMRGLLKDDDNAAYSNIYKEKHEMYFDKCKDKDNMDLITVDINFITCYGPPGKQYVDKIDFVKRITYRVDINDSLLRNRLP